MTTRLSASDWAAARGDKWRANLAGMEATLAPVDAPLIEALALAGPLRIADVGCGGGATAFEIARRAAAGSVVHGFDIAPASIEAARGRAANVPRVSFDVLDVASAPAPERPYDRLVSRFGIMFFDDPSTAFANLARWLVPGGRFAFAVWGPVADNVWMTTVRDVVAAIAPVPAPEPDAPGPFRYASVAPLLQLLDRAGLGELAVSDWRGALPIGGGLGAADAAAFGLGSFSSFAEMLAAAGADARAEAQRALTARLAAHEHDGVVRMDASVQIVTGTWKSIS